MFAPPPYFFQGKGISGPEDTFSFNADFTSKLKRVRIPLVSIKDSASGPSASASLPPAVEEDRRYDIYNAVRRSIRHLVVVVVMFLPLIWVLVGIWL